MEDQKNEHKESESVQQFENIDIKSSPDEYNRENVLEEPDKVSAVLITHDSVFVGENSQICYFI